MQVTDSGTHEVIETLRPDPDVLHMEFSGRGGQVWISVRDVDQSQVWDPYRLKHISNLSARSPNGILFSHRAQHIEPQEAPRTASPAASPPTTRKACQSVRNPIGGQPRPWVAVKLRYLSGCVAWKPTTCRRGSARCSVTSALGSAP